MDWFDDNLIRLENMPDLGVSEENSHAVTIQEYIQNFHPVSQACIDI
jgi:hypothetical protein